MLGGPAYWTFEGGFGSTGVPGWGDSQRWLDVISGAINPFRRSGSVAQFPVGQGTSPPIITSGPVVLPVVISEQPSTLYPGSSPRGSISKEIDVPEGFYECVIQGVTRLCQEKPPEGWTDLPPVPEIFGDIIRSPVPVPVDDNEENDMAIDWGTLASGVIDVLQGQQIGGGAQPLAAAYNPNQSAFAGGSSMPRTVTVDTVTGKVSKCKRRRRRTLLTNGDFNDLMRIATLPNNANVRTALAKAVGRR